MAFIYFVHEKQKQKNDIALLNVLTSTTQQQQQQQNDIALFNVLTSTKEALMYSLSGSEDLKNTRAVSTSTME